MPSIPLPTIKLGKRKERSLMCEVFTDDGRWVDREMPALSSCVDDEATGMTYLIDGDNQFLAEDNNWHQLLTEKSQIPLCLRKTSVYQDGKNDDVELKAVSDDIFKLAFSQRQMEALKKAKSEDVWTKFTWIVSIVCGTILIIAMAHQFLG
jgi:hypothetical protein